jgi:small subunit ribosomal protein S2
MERMPGAMFVIDQRREVNAVREARKMGVPVVCLLDTDCDPDMVDIAIPGNDDAMRAIELVLTELCNVIAEGMHMRQEKATPEEGDASQEPRRRSRRPTTARAADADADKPGAEEAPAPAEGA